MQNYGFVTVIFEAELELLRLQARSLALYAPADLIDEIVVIDNCERPFDARYRARLLAEYGRHRDKVRILRASDIVRIPITKGWRSQQILKLAVADQLRSSRYLVLDGKTHLIFPLARDFLEGPDGRPTVNTYSFETHPLREPLTQILNYLGVDPTPFVPKFTATVAPFVLDTTTVRDLMRDIAARSGRSFADEFTRQEMTEFFLYTGWIVASGRTIDAFFHVHQRFCQIIWEHRADLTDCYEAIAAARASREPFFAVHRRAIARFDPQRVELVAAFWVECGLFSDLPTAVAYLSSFRDDFISYRKFDRVRAVPAQVMTVLRRGLRRFVR